MQNVASRPRNVPRGARSSALLVTFCVLSAFAPTAPSADGGDPLADLAGRISRTRLERNIRELSGVDSVVIDGTPAALTTRYTYSRKKPLAARYLIRELERAGYRPYVQEFRLDLTPPDFHGLTVSAGRDTVWAGAYDGGVYRATAADGWASFELIGRVSHEIQALTVDGGGRLWAACGLIGSSGGALFLSRDGGATWEKRAAGPDIAHLNDLAFADESTAVAAGRNGTAIRTRDAGERWEPISPGLWTIHGISAPAPRHVWMAGDGGRICESNNVGDEWTITQLTTVRLLDIAFSDERHGITGGEDGVYATRDGGLTWDGFPTEEWIWSVAMADSGRAAAAGNDGTLLLSEDGGASWTGLDVSLSGGTDFNEAVFMGRDTLWTAGRFEIRLFDLSDPRAPAVRRYQIGDTLSGYNLVARVPGTSRPEERILLCGHYDSYATDADPMVLAPGADDNASGTACVLEVARALTGARLERTVEFVLFDGEERGLQGSRHFVGSLDSAARYTAVINLDMLAFDPAHTRSLTIAGRANTIDSTLAPFFTRAVDTLHIGITPRFATDISPISDHLSFWTLEGIPTVLCTESGYSANPNANASTDTLGYLDFDYLEAVSRAVFGGVALLAGFEGSVQLVPAALAPVVPNPFNDLATIAASLPSRQPIDVTVFDVRGRAVRTIERGIFGPELLVRTWDGTDRSGRRVASGVYFVRLRAGRTEMSRKIVVVR